MPLVKYSDYDELLSDENSENTTSQALPPSESKDQTPIESEATLLADTLATQESESADTPSTDNDKAGFWRTQLAYFRQENLLGSVGTWAVEHIARNHYHAQDMSIMGTFIPGKRDPNFNLADSLETVPEEDQHLYLDCNTQLEFDYVQSCLEEEKEDIKIIADTSGWSHVGHTVLNLIDPALLVPFAKLGMAYKSGAPLLSKMATGAKAGAVVGGVYNATTYATHNYRKIDETLANTVFTTVLGGVLPVVGMGLSKINLLRKKFVKVASDPASEFYYVPNKKNPEEFFEVEVSSTEAPDKLAISKKYSKIAKGTQQFLRASIWGRAVISPFKTVNKMADLYMRSNYVSNKVLEGVDRYPTVESLKDLSMGESHKFYDEAANILKKFLKSKPAIETLATKDEFLAVVRHDILLGPNNDIIKTPEVKYFSALWRKSLQQKLDEAYEYGVNKYKWNLHEPVEGLFYDVEKDIWVKEHYFPRVYDCRKINDNRKEFETLLFKINQATTMRGATSEQILEKSRNQILSIMGINPGEQFQPVLSFEEVRSILGTSESLSAFTVNNPIEAFTHIDRQISSKTALNKALKMRGIKDLDELRNELTEEFKSNPSIDMKQFQKAVRLFNDIDALHTGSFQHEQMMKSPKLYAAVRGTRDIVSAAVLGSTLITSFKDIGLIINHKGIKEPASLIAKDIVNKFFSYEPTIMGKYKSDLYEACVAIESNVLKTSQFLNTPLGDHRSYRSGDLIVGRLKKLNSWIISGSQVPKWTDIMKTWNGSLFVNDIFKRATKKTLDKADRVWLSEYRIPSEFVPRIKEQFEKYGEVYDKFHYPNLKLWNDKEAKEIVASAISTQSHTTVLLPSKYDVPRYYHSTFGPFFLMFESFAYSLTNNLIAPWTTGTAKHKVAALTADIGLSAAVKYIKAYLNANPYGGIYDDQLWADTAESLDIFGYTPRFARWGYDIFNGFISGGAKELLYRIARGAPGGSYYANVVDTASYWTKQSGEPMPEYMIRKHLDMIPGKSLIGINTIVNGMAKSIARSTGGKLIKTRKERYLERKGE